MNSFEFWYNSVLFDIMSLSIVGICFCFCVVFITGFLWKSFGEEGILDKPHYFAIASCILGFIASCTGFIVATGSYSSTEIIFITCMSIIYTIGMTVLVIFKVCKNLELI